MTDINMKGTNENLFVQLEKSIRKFHSHHWFHIAEFFLYKPLLQPILNGRNKTAIILPPSSNFFNQLTPMSIFFLLVSLPIQNLNQAAILNPKSLTKSVSISNNIPYNNNQNNFTYSLTDSKQHNQYQYYIWTNQPPLLIKNDTNHPNLYNKILQLQSSSSSSIEHSLFHHSISILPTSFTSTDINYHFGKYPQDTQNWLNSSKESDVIRNRISYLCKDYNQSLIFDNKYIKYWTFKNNVLTRFFPSSNIIDSTHYSNSNNNKVPNKPLRLAVYQRDINRHFHHLRHNLQLLFEQLSIFQNPVILTKPVIMNQSIESLYNNNQQLPSSSSTLSNSWLITIIRHNEQTQPCDLYYSVHDADLYLTTHGFQAMCKYSVGNIDNIIHYHFRTVHHVNFNFNACILNVILYCIILFQVFMYI